MPLRRFIGLMEDPAHANQKPRNLRPPNTRDIAGSNQAVLLLYGSQFFSEALEPVDRVQYA